MSSGAVADGMVCLKTYMPGGKCNCGISGITLGILRLQYTGGEGCGGGASDCGG